MADPKVKLAVFISGGGSNLQSLIDASAKGDLSADIVLVVSSSSKAFGLERARKAGIDTFVYLPKRYESVVAAQAALLAELLKHRVDYIALAGYLKLIPGEIIRAFPGRMTNIHPGLLPKYGGKGMYGHYVHEAVLASGDKESGPTVHLVDEIYDHGRILAQRKVPVMPDDTPETLAARVLEQEHLLYPVVLEKLIRGDYDH